jgi:multidrug efflux system outer membrane protein
MTKFKAALISLLLLALCGCKVGPNYKRPDLNVPGDYRGLPPGPQPTGDQFGDMKWWTVFQDETLQALIREALTNNYDIRIAASRILQARAALGITRADQYPTLNGTGAIINERNQFFRGDPTFGSLGLELSYVVDFWGQYRRATEAARANLLATEYAQNVVRTTLVSDIATLYFVLRQYDAQLKYSQDTVTADEEIVKINEIKFKGGDAAISDVYQAQVLLQTAQAQAISLQSSIEQTENNISILLGKPPAAVTRGLELTAQPHIPEVPAGLPSALLQRRPDIQQAEQNLVAANANVGVAKANFFPQFAITGTFGAQSTSLSSFIDGPATFWSAGIQAVQPIFQGGRIKSQYRLAWAQRDEAELQYKKTVNQAFGDVSNGLVGYYQARLFRMKIEEQTHSYSETARLANVRFLGGYTSFLEVEYNQQQYFTSALQLAQAWGAELQSYVFLYQALGGGWQQ